MLFGFVPASDVAVTLTMSFKLHAALFPLVKRHSNGFLQMEVTKSADGSSSWGGRISILVS